MSISLYFAIKRIGNYIKGNRNISEININNSEKRCIKCNNVLTHTNSIINDFINIYIYECNNCNTVSEYQYDKNNNMLKEVHLYTKVNNDSSSYSELLDDIKSESFSIDKLYTIDTFLCFPVLLYNNFFNKVDVVFVKINDVLKYNEIHGFVIHNNIIGYLDINKQDHIGYFYNPYLSNLPHKEFNFVPIKQNISENLKPINCIRYKYNVENKDYNIYLHKLEAILDMPLKCIGLCINLEFYTYNIPDGIRIIDHLRKLDLYRIITLDNIVPTGDNYTIKSFSIIKHTLSSISDKNISLDLKKELYFTIEKFFEEYDKGE